MIYYNVIHFSRDFQSNVDHCQFHWQKIIDAPHEENDRKIERQGKRIP